MRVLFVGGTGEISLSCVREAVTRGLNVTVFNRGKRSADLPQDVERIEGDLADDAAYRDLAARNFDAVCHFLIFNADDMRRNLAAFSGRTGQFVFVSSASCYQKPAERYLLREDVPLVNPFNAYSRNKAAAEAILTAQSDLPFTIVRPSHTIRTRFPTVLGEHRLLPWRMVNGKAVVTHGDGTSLWTVTRSEDFAVPFVGLLGKDAALGQAVHITSDRAFTWDQLYRGIADALGTRADIVHVPTDTILKFMPDQAATLLGDKMASTLFDNAKIKGLVGDFECVPSLTELLAGPAEFYRSSTFEPGAAELELDAALDRMIGAQRAVRPDQA